MLKTKTKRPYELYSYMNKKTSEGIASNANRFLLNLLSLWKNLRKRISLFAARIADQWDYDSLSRKPLSVLYSADFSTAKIFYGVRNIPVR